MKFQIVSDLHIDVEPLGKLDIAPDADVLIVAGDVCEGAEKSFEAIRRLATREIPVVAVLGNHEFYRRNLRDEIAHARQVAPSYGIDLLEDDSIVLGGSVRLIGANLWTDYALFGDANIPFAMQSARSGMNDHKRIEWAHNPWKRFRPEEAAFLHHRSRRYISETLAAPFSGSTVVISHTAPHPGSLGARFRHDLLSSAFVSDLGTLIERGQPALWVHGHTHESFDYVVGGTRVLCNPRGYGRENPSFDPGLTVEIA